VELIIYPDPILRKENEAITDEDLNKLSKELVTGMINYGGIGLAGPQIGIKKRIAVISENASEGLTQPLLLVNPVIIESSGNQSIEEGCLSVLGVNAYVPRADLIKVETGPPGDRKVIAADGMLSIVIQHEIDHLNGIIFPDRLSYIKKLWCLLKARLNKRNAKKT
jgi:peptide deformylase